VPDVAFFRVVEQRGEQVAPGLITFVALPRLADYRVLLIE
jgi:hypothetical protein